MGHEIQKASYRKTLKPNPNDVYWRALDKGLAIGFRKLDAERGTWMARRRAEAGEGRTGSGSYETKPLGAVTDALDYGAAKALAEAWFKDRAQGISDDAPTVEAVCKEYVAALRADGKERTAKNAEYKLKPAVYDTDFGRTQLDKLRTLKIREWRNALPGGPSTQNRTFASLKAALNAAVLNRRVSAAVSIEWKSVKMHESADGRRDLFLDLKQRRALIDACKGGVRNLVEAAALTGARPGELIALKRGDFDARTGTLRISEGKTGYRAVPLAPAAVKFFKRLSKGKMPNTSLITMDNGEPWQHHALWAREIREAATRAELPPGVVLYTLRHSFITEALRAGVPVLDVAKLTGTSLEMIQKNYAQFVPDGAREALKAVKLV
jgi:integrase